MRTCTLVRVFFVSLTALFAGLSNAEMERISDNALSEVTGQSGVYLSGEVTVNENGGPLDNAYFGDCAAAGKVCGARIAAQTQQGGGWFVINNLKGSVAFEGLTLQLRIINSGFGGDGALFNRDVIEIGMPSSLRFKDFEYTLATSSNARPGEGGFQQVDLMTVELGGEVTLEGNLLVFPTP